MDGTQVKVVAWYDNEWGYANRLVELAERVLAAVPSAPDAPAIAVPRRNDVRDRGAATLTEHDLDPSERRRARAGNATPEPPLAARD
jgi:hypothetical protein